MFTNEFQRIVSPHQTRFAQNAMLESAGVKISVGAYRFHGVSAPARANSCLRNFRLIVLVSDGHKISASYCIANTVH
jgi:hypothetical protein